MYIDFFLKKIAESFIRNIFVSGAFLIGEKYIIEHLTKSAGDKVISLFSDIYSNPLSSSLYVIVSFLTLSMYILGFSFLYYFLWL